MVLLCERNGGRRSRSEVVQERNVKPGCDVMILRPGINLSNSDSCFLLKFPKKARPNMCIFRSVIAISHINRETAETADSLALVWHEN